MTRRVVGVLARSASTGVAPPGVDARAFALAMLEDVVDLVSGMREVEPALIVEETYAEDARGTVWPGTTVCALADGSPALEALDRLVAIGADEATLLVADVPDLPPLLLGKLHSALTHAQVAVCPALGGGVVAMAVRAPVPDWLRAGEMSDLGESEFLEALRRVAPPRSLSIGPGWHRIRAA